jgi:hypothetical protein
MTQRLPPVLSRQVSRPIVLPTKATPLKHIPHIPSAEHAGYPKRIDGGRERGTQSHHIPTHADILSTLQPTQDKGPGPAPTTPPSGLVIHAEGTNDVQSAGVTPLCNVTFDRPRPCTLYVAIRPGIAAGTAPGFAVPGAFTLIGTVRVGRGRAATRFNFDLPLIGSVSAAGYIRSPIIELPLDAENIDVSMRWAPFGWGLSNLVWASAVLPNANPDSTFDDPPVLQPGQGPNIVVPVTAWVAEGESTPRLNYPLRRVTSILDASGGATPSMIIPICMGVDRVSLLSDGAATPVAQPAVTYAFIGPGAVGNIAGLLPNEEPLVIPDQCHQIKVTNSDGANPHNFCLIQYSSL